MTTPDQFIVSADVVRGSAATGRLPSGVTQLASADIVDDMGRQTGRSMVITNLALVALTLPLAACAATGAPSPETAGSIQPILRSFNRTDAIAQGNNERFITNLENSLPGYKVENVSAIASSDGKTSYTLFTLRNSLDPKAPLKYMVNIDVPIDDQGTKKDFTGPVDQFRALGADGMVKWQVYLAPIAASESVAAVWNAKTIDKGNFQILEMDFQANLMGDLAQQPGESPEQWSQRINAAMVNGDVNVIRALAENTKDPSRLRRLAIGNPMLSDTRQTWEVSQANRSLLDALLAPDGVAYAAADDATATPEAAQPTGTTPTDVPATPTDAPSTSTPEASPTPEATGQFSEGELPSTADIQIDLAGSTPQSISERTFAYTWKFKDYAGKESEVTAQILLAQKYYDELVAKGEQVTPDTIARFISPNVLPKFQKSFEYEWDAVKRKWKHAHAPVVVLTGAETGYIFGDFATNGDAQPSARALGRDSLVAKQLDLRKVVEGGFNLMWSDALGGIVAGSESKILMVQTEAGFKALPYPRLLKGPRKDQEAVLNNWDSLSVADRTAILDRWFTQVVDADSFNSNNRGAQLAQLKEQFLRFAVLDSLVPVRETYRNGTPIEYYDFGGSVLGGAPKPDHPFAMLYAISKIRYVPNLKFDGVLVYSVMSGGAVDINIDRGWDTGNNHLLNVATAFFSEAWNATEFGLGSNDRATRPAQPQPKAKFIDYQQALVQDALMTAMVKKGAAQEGEFARAQAIAYFEKAQRYQADVVKPASK